MRNRIDVRLINNKKEYLKCTTKPSYLSHKIFDNNLVAICKSKVKLKLNKTAYIGMCILKLSKVLMYKFHCDCSQSKYGHSSKILLADIDSLIYKIKIEDVYEDFSSDKKMFDLCNYSTKSKYYDDSQKLVIEKMKDKARGVAIEEFLGLKPKMYSFLVDEGVDRNVVATRSHNEYKYVLLNETLNE